MRVFMLGWEFPPHISGGLGTACFGLTKGLKEVGVDISFVLPTAVPPAAVASSHVALRSPVNLKSRPTPLRTTTAAAAVREEEILHQMQHVQVTRLAALLQPYGTQKTFEQSVKVLLEHKKEFRQFLSRDAMEALQSVESTPETAAEAATQASGAMSVGPGANYAGDLMGQVQRYARLASELARDETFDIIHAHDWMTYPAGLAVAAVSGKPLVVHVHSTEFDRSGENVNQQVYDIERAGMHGAARVVCVSHLTRNIVLARYGVPADKVEVVYNAVELPGENAWPLQPIRHTEKIVLFLGRLTLQKGPEYFLRAAKLVVEKFQNVRFVVAGSGDMITECIRLAADLRLGKYVTFTGFLRGDDVAKVFRMADLYIMPSVSEPFGIAPLEALSHNVPVIISKQSGVSEVLSHVLKVDFWDTDEMANKILAVLRHPPLQRTLRQYGQIELRKLSWRDSAALLKEIYISVLGNG